MCFPLFVLVSLQAVGKHTERNTTIVVRYGTRTPTRTRTVECKEARASFNKKKGASFPEMAAMVSSIPVAALATTSS